MQLKDGDVLRVSACALTCIDEPWPFAESHRAAIEQHWAAKMLANSQFFNGDVLILLRHRFNGGRLEGTYTQTDFASYIYWQDTGYSDTTVRDGFGSAIIRSVEGHVLLGVQGGGNLNSGRAYFPGGFVDPRDVRHDGSVDIAESVLREISEETGLDNHTFERLPGYLLSVSGPLISIGIEFRSTLSSAALKERIMQHLRAEGEPELADVLIVRNVRDIDDSAMPAFTTQVLRKILAAD